MSYCCSQCNFTTQFESALMMHHQLHHETPSWNVKSKVITDKSNTVPRTAGIEKFFSNNENKGQKLPGRTSSATKLFGKLRARICRSKMLFSHPEEADRFHLNDLTTQSECTSKALKDPILSCCDLDHQGQRETYSCHLCSFNVDRITVLDRHLLNDHKIGMENLLKLVMAKTKDGLTEDIVSQVGIRQPYYKPPDDIIEHGEFVIETVTPKIKILKHVATNTDLIFTDIPDVGSCRLREIGRLTAETQNKDVLLAKMQTLNECMCKFVDSTNTLKEVLTKELDQKNADRSSDGLAIDLGLGDRDSPQNWNRAHSEKMERSRNKYGDNRSEKLKHSNDSFYF